jgi:hypothetical protein
VVVRKPSMSGELGPIEFVCDAPPYPVVKACSELGFSRPQDVRWQRVDRKSVQPRTGLLPWRRAAAPCSCGTPLPDLESYTFTFVSGSQAKYYLGQCRHCRTIYWDQD